MESEFPSRPRFFNLRVTVQVAGCMRSNAIVAAVAVVVVVIVAVTAFLLLQEKPEATPSGNETDITNVTIRYGGQYYAGEFLLYGLGPQFWHKYGIYVSHYIFPSAGPANDALIAGSIDINCGADTRTVTLFTAMPDKALIIGTVERGDRYSTVVSVNSTYQNWIDLKGKKIGIKLGTGGECVLRKHFEQQGIKWEDYQWLNMEVTDMVAYLQQGKIDAFHAWEFTPSIAEAKGVGRVIRTYGDIALTPASIHTTKKFVEENREAVVRFLAAQMEKADLIKNDPDEAARIAHEAAAQIGVDVPVEAFKKSFQRVDYQIEFNQTIIDAVVETAEFLKSQKKIENIPTIVWDDTLLEDARKYYERIKQG